MTFDQAVLRCAANTELVTQFDRLNGTNLSRKGSPIELAIDDASGRTNADLAKFVDFVAEIVQRVEVKP